MRRKLEILLIILSLFGLTNCRKAKTDIFYQKKYVKEIKEAREKAASYLFRNFIPGANLAISIHGELVYSEGIGLASKDLNVKTNRKTKFRIGDVSQLFTDAIYQKLVDEGTLSPDSGVQVYYPEFPEKQYPVYLKNLANEMTGIRAPENKDHYREGLNITTERALNRFAKDSLVFEPETYQLPSAYNYNLLGVVLEKATGKSFHDLLKSYISDTLHLENTQLDNPYPTVENRSCFYDLNVISQVVNAMFYDLRQNAPSEGILSTADDLVKFGNALLLSGYFDSARDRIFTPAHYKNGEEANMSNGWVIIPNRNGRKIYGRQGSVPGGSSSLLIFPEEQIVVAFACNLPTSLDDTPVFQMAEPFLKPLETANTPDDRNTSEEK